MKVTLNPDNSVSFETSTVDEAIVLARRLQNGNGPEPTRRSRGPIEEFVTALTVDTPPKEERRPVADEEVAVGPQLLATWQYLVDNGSSSGTAATEVAAGMKLQVETARYRLTRLVKLGLAHRSSHGFYVPGPGEG